MTRYVEWLTDPAWPIACHPSDYQRTLFLKSFRPELGRTKALGLFISMLVVCYGVKEYLRCRLIGDARMPKTSYHPLNGVYMKGVEPAISQEMAVQPAKVVCG